MQILKETIPAMPLCTDALPQGDDYIKQGDSDYNNKQKKGARQQKYAAYINSVSCSTLKMQRMKKQVTE